MANPRLVTFRVWYSDGTFHSILCGRTVLLSQNAQVSVICPPAGRTVLPLPGSEEVLAAGTGQSFSRVLSGINAACHLAIQ